MVEQSVHPTQDVRDRVERGLGLVGRVQAHGDLFIVHGSVQPNGQSRNYTVCLEHQTYGETCSCPDWKVNVLERGNLDHRCKHIIATTIYNAKSCRRGPKILRH